MDIRSINRELLALIIFIQWGLIFSVSFAGNFSIFKGAQWSLVAANSEAPANPIAPSLTTFKLRLILQFFQFLSYAIIGFNSLQKSGNGFYKIFDKKLLFFVFVHTTTYTISLLFLNFGRTVEGTFFLCLMNLMSWKVQLDLALRCHQVQEDDLPLYTKLVLVFMQNCFSAFSAFSYLVAMCMVNGVMIHKFGIPENSASFFTLGIICHGIFAFGLLDFVQLSKYTTYIFMHGFMFVWVFKGIRENLEQGHFQEHNTIFFLIHIIENCVNCMVLFKFLKITHKLALNSSELTTVPRK